MLSSFAVLYCHCSLQIEQMFFFFSPPFSNDEFLAVFHSLSLCLSLVRTRLNTLRVLWSGFYTLKGCKVDVVFGTTFCAYQKIEEKTECHQNPTGFRWILMSLYWLVKQAIQTFILNGITPNIFATEKLWFELHLVRFYWSISCQWVVIAGFLL